MGAHQSEGLKKATVRIRDARDFREAVGSEKVLRLLIVIGEVYESKLRAQSFDLRPQFADVVDGFAAEGAAKVAQENEEHRLGS